MSVHRAGCGEREAERKEEKKYLRGKKRKTFQLKYTGQPEGEREAKENRAMGNDEEAETQP